MLVKKQYYHSRMQDFSNKCNSTHTWFVYKCGSPSRAICSKQALIPSFSQAKGMSLGPSQDPISAHLFHALSSSSNATLERSLGFAVKDLIVMSNGISDSRKLWCEILTLPGSGCPRSSLFNFVGYFKTANISTHKMLANESG